MIKCIFCDGLGSISAAKEAGMENMPYMMQPIGVRICANCGGSGEVKDFFEGMDKAVLDDMKKRFARLQKD